MTTPAGWYEDPEQPGGQRYWDGYDWTDNKVVPPSLPSEQPTMDTPTGWYADPQQPRRWRYWDGEQWTEHYSDDSQEQEPGAFRRWITQADKKERDAKIRCPHCGEVGKVTTQPNRVKRGVSGGKATGAVLTGGVSILATGLSRKQTVTELRCKNCGMKWQEA